MKICLPPAPAPALRCPEPHEVCPGGLVQDTPSQEAVEEAARQANAHDFITGFPDGYETE